LKTRKPHVAGQFYAGTKAGLEQQITECFTHRYGPGAIPKTASHGARKIVGIVSPHAGYAYSGPIAANGYGRMAQDGLPEAFIILGPNHYGRGSGVAIQTEGVWETPLGTTPIDTPLAKSIQKASEIIDIDDSAHFAEHSIEVQVPFIQYISKGTAKIVPICSRMQDLRTSRDIAKSIVEQTKNKDISIIASSDFTHHERGYEDKNEKEMLAKIEAGDRSAIEAITKLDDAALNELGESQKVTMCGFGPITTLIAAAKLLGSTRAEFLAHKTSYDITGDSGYVVGYSSIVFSRN
jgi:AmmeMemoRadiSam system protein B